MVYCCIGRHANEPGALWCRECGSMVEGALIEDYRILSFVGKGSTAEVYLAEQTAPVKRKVVIKILPQGLSGSRVETFQREASMLASLSHPYILPIFSYGLLYRQVQQQEDAARRDGNSDDEEESAQGVRCLPYLVLAYAARGSLADIFAREGNRPWSLNRIVSIARETADALDYAHDQGVLHRDVKPANILHMGTHVLLSDFSVATLIDAEVSHLNAPWAGSPAYMAPEVWQLRPGRYSDQYSLAISCFHLLTGDLPLRRNAATRSRSWAHLHNFVPPRSILELRADLPLAVDIVLKRALSKNPHDRYPTVSAFAADLLIASQDDTQGLVAMIDTKEIGAKPVPAGHSGAPAGLPGDRQMPSQRQQAQPRADVAFVGAGAPRSAPAVLPAPVVREPVTGPGNLPAALQPPQPQQIAPYQALRQQPVKPAPGDGTASFVPGKEGNRWVWYALLLNFIICLALVAESALQGNTLQARGDLALALWPTLLAGPLLALFFRHLSYTSLSWGLFWGTFFGLTGGLLSTLLCITWFALAQLIANGISGASLTACMQALTSIAPQAVLPIVTGMWISVVGGALIGLSHMQDDEL